MSRRIFPAPDAIVDTRSHFLVGRMSGISEVVPSADVFVDYAVIYMSAGQTARISVANRVELDSATYIGSLTSADVTVSTGSEQANGLLTLKGARRWKVVWHALTTSNEGYLIASWTTGAGAAILDEIGRNAGEHALRRRDSGSNNDNNLGIVGQSIIDATAADVLMEMRFSSVVSPPHSVDMRVDCYPLGAVI